MHVPALDGEFAMWAVEGDADCQEPATASYVEKLEGDIARVGLWTGDVFLPEFWGWRGPIAAESHCAENETLELFCGERFERPIGESGNGDIIFYDVSL